jgi:hypothetical protein
LERSPVKQYWVSNVAEPNPPEIILLWLYEIPVLVVVMNGV